MKYGFIGLLTWLVVSSAAAQEEGGVRTFVRVPGIEGGVVAAGYEGWIEVDGFSGSFRKDACDSIGFTKAVDVASVPLIVAASTGEPFDTIVVESVDDDGAVRFTVTLQEARLLEVKLGSEEPREQVSLEAVSVALEYTTPARDGSAQEPATEEVSCGSVGVEGSAR